MIINVAATSANLGPGFDSLGVALSLKNCFTIKRSSTTSVEVQGEGSSNPKLCMDNIFIKIFYQHYQRLTGQKDDFFSFKFDNAIPISRGLGSSSAVIIGAISAAYWIAQKPCTTAEILYQALKYEPHPDNITPACVGGFTVSITQSDRIHFLRKDLPDYIKAIIVIPDRSISTAQSRSALPKRYNKQDTVFNLSHSSLLTAAFFSHNWDYLKEASKDRLHQSIRMRQFPILFDIQKLALKEGALMSTLSGSGSSFFNLCYNEDTKRIRKKLACQFPSFRVLELSFNNHGIEKIEDNL